MLNILSNIITVLFFPILLLQGFWARRHIPRLPGASGPSTGLVSGRGQTINLLVIGESTAAGVGAATHKVALTGQAASALARHTGRPVRWRAIGRNGATAHATYQDLVPQIGAAAVDAAIIALGVNDVKRLHPPARWRRDLQRVVETVRQQAGPIPVVLAGIPPLDRFPALPQPLRTFLGLRATVLDRAAVALAASLPGVRHCPTQVRDSNDFASDGFHPGPAGYAAWGDELAQVLARLLAEVDGRLSEK